MSPARARWFALSVLAFVACLPPRPSAWHEPSGPPSTSEVTPSAPPASVAETRLRAVVQTLHRSVGAHAYSPDGQILATADMPTVELWDVASGILLRTLQPSRRCGSSRLGTLAFTADGRTLVEVNGCSAIEWDIETGRSLRDYDVPETLTPFAQTSDGTTVVVRDPGGLSILDVASGGQRRLAWTGGTDDVVAASAHSVPQERSAGSCEKTPLLECRELVASGGNIGRAHFDRLVEGTPAARQR